jgi:peptidyl-tRNA hydrolase
MSKHRKRILKREKFDLGGVWMMVSIQASVSGSNFVNFCKFMLALVVLSYVNKKGEIVATMAPFAISSSLILVIHDNMINGTNHIV